MFYSDVEDEEDDNPDIKRRVIANPELFDMVPKLTANETRRTKTTVVSGGFCEVCMLEIVFPHQGLWG